MRKYPSFWESEAKFLSWLRSGLRRVWNKHPVKLSLKKNNRFKAINKKTGKSRWHGTCVMCKKDHFETALQVDHKNPMPKLEIENIKQYMFALMFVEEEDLQLLCKPCHSVKTYAERGNMPIEYAIIHKTVIKNTKSSKSAKEFCKKHGVEYKNMTQAKEALLKQLKAKTAMAFVLHRHADVIKALKDL